MDVFVTCLVRFIKKMSNPSDTVILIKRWLYSLLFCFVFNLFFMIPIFLCFSSCDFTIQKDLKLQKESIFGIILAWAIQVLIFIIYALLYIILKDDFQKIRFFQTFKTLFFMQTFAILLVLFSCIFIFNYSYFPDINFNKEQLSIYDNTTKTIKTIGFLAFIPNSLLIFIMLIIICCTD